MKRDKPTLFSIVAPVQGFFRLEASGGLVLIAAAALAIVWANSRFASLYEGIFHSKITMQIANRGIDWTVHHFTNDGLMTLFFAIVGLEIKREITHGELRTLRQAALPLVAAIGGMLAPAAIYLAMNREGLARSGWAVPMATDIAFALGCLSLVKSRVPASLFVFLTALAIFDDLGAILVIALFYGHGIDPRFLGLSVVACVALFALGRARVQRLWPYAAFGICLWGALLESGIHATLAGVAVGLAIPADPKRPPLIVLDDLERGIASLRADCIAKGTTPDGTIAAIERHLERVQSPLDRAMHALHGLVAFGVVPLFALANAGVTVEDVSLLTSPVTLGSFLGLALGKPIGVAGATLAALGLGIAARPTGATTLQIIAVGCLSGIGFTMSLLVGSLAFADDRSLEDAAKLGVLGASIGAALLGLGLLLLSQRAHQNEQTESVASHA